MTFSVLVSKTQTVHSINDSRLLQILLSKSYSQQNYFIQQDTKNFVNEKFNKDLALADWRTVYQQRTCDEMFAEFNRIF